MDSISAQDRDNSLALLYTAMNFHVPLTTGNLFTVAREKNIVKGHTGLGAKNDCADEGQQQLKTNRSQI
jgi:hypothetical protein